MVDLPAIGENQRAVSASRDLAESLQNIATQLDKSRLPALRRGKRQDSPVPVNEIPPGRQKLGLSAAGVESHAAEGPVWRRDHLEQLALLVFSHPPAPRVLLAEESHC